MWNCCPVSATWSRAAACDAWDHCAHTAALCYQLARLLDQDPFVLLLMRGRGERVLLDELQVRSVASASAGSADEEADEEPVDADGVDATEAFAAGSILPPLPAAPPVPSEAGPVPSLDTDTEPPTGTDVAALEFLAARAAAEAHRMLTDALAAGHELRAPDEELTIHQDAVRLAAGAPEAWIGARLAEGSGRDGEGLAAAVLAWEHGGTAGLSVLEDEWTPDAETAGTRAYGCRSGLGRRGAPAVVGRAVIGGRPPTRAHRSASAATAAGGRSARTAAGGSRRARRPMTRPRRCRPPSGTSDVRPGWTRACVHPGGPALPAHRAPQALAPAPYRTLPALRKIPGASGPVHSRAWSAP